MHQLMLLMVKKPTFWSEFLERVDKRDSGTQCGRVKCVAEEETQVLSHGSIDWHSGTIALYSSSTPANPQPE